MMTSWIYNSRSHHCIEMKLNNISRIWNFIHKDLKNEKFPEDYNEDAQLKLQETLERIVNEGSGGLICIIL